MNQQRHNETLADFRALHAEVGDPHLASQLLIAARLDGLHDSVSCISQAIEEWSRYALDYLGEIAHPSKPASQSHATRRSPARRGRPPGSKNKSKPAAPSVTQSNEA